MEDSRIDYNMNQAHIVHGGFTANESLSKSPDPKQTNHVETLDPSGQENNILSCFPCSGTSQKHRNFSTKDTVSVFRRFSRGTNENSSLEALNIARTSLIERGAISIVVLVYCWRCRVRVNWRVSSGSCLVPVSEMLV